MPDTKFSWRGLREHLRKYLWVYLVGVALCLVGTNLLWTTTQPRAENDETVNIYMADAWSNPEPLADVAADMLARTQPFDEKLKEVAFQSLMFTEGDYNSNILLITRLAVGEADAFLASPAAMEALATSQALEPLDDYVAKGWLSEYGLEPHYVTLEDEETGAQTTYLAALQIDSLTALADRGAFFNEGAFLCVTGNGGNTETTMKAIEFMLEDLTQISTEGQDAGTEAE